MSRTIIRRATSFRHGGLTLGALALFLIAIAILFTAGGKAANPTSGTVTEANTLTNPLVYTGGPFVADNKTGLANFTCGPAPANPCDDFTLTVNVGPGQLDTNQIRVNVAWPNPPGQIADFDLFIYKDGAQIASSASSSDPEAVLLPAVPAVYTIRVVPFTGLGQGYTATINYEAKSPNNVQGSGLAPKFQNFAAPFERGWGLSAGEPSIGFNPRTGSVMFQSGLQTLRARFNDSTSPATATWDNKSAPNAFASLDPILFTDQRTGRTITSQLSGGTSLSSYSDNDGDTWIPNEGGPMTSGVDHQTVGGGRYAGDLSAIPNPAYPDATYYCSQDLYTAFCARSDNGGLTYGPTVPIYSTVECGGIHGHVKVSPADGAVYVPNRQCGAHQGLAVSTDNGLTWTTRQVMDGDSTTNNGDSMPSSWDPSIGIGKNGTLYFGYKHGDGTARIAVSHDHGNTWTNDQNVGRAFNIRNSAFPTVVAGDDDRAAFAFLGTDKFGDDVTAVWHLYVATTYDGGRSYITVDATPTDPVQIGTICAAGISCNGDRNLLDFIDSTIDAQGRVLVGYADGCVGCNSKAGSTTALASIARQSCGRPLYAQFDTIGNCSIDPAPLPTPTPPATVCSGIGVITDVAGDAINPGAGGAATGTTDQADITSGDLLVDAGHTTLTTRMTIKNLSLIPLNGATSMGYYTVFTAPNGKQYASLAQLPSGGGPIDYLWGEYDGQFLTTINFTTGSIVTGPNGTVSVNVPLSGIGNPVIPVDAANPAAVPAVRNHYSLVVAGEAPVLGGAVVFTAPADRAPTFGFGSNWAACSASPTPTPTPTPSPGSPCSAPGTTVVSDNRTNDATDSQANHDIVNAAISYPYTGSSSDQLTFTIKVASLSTLTPSSFYFTSFTIDGAPATAGNVYGVRMVVGNTGAVTFESYLAGASNSGAVDGRFVSGTPVPAEAGSNYNANGTITINVKPSNIGIPSPVGGHTLGLFNGGVAQTAAGVATAILDWMPAGGDGVVDTTPPTRGGTTFTVQSNQVCNTNPTPTPTATPTPTPAPTPVSVPRYLNYAPPPAIGETSGEPSIGYNPATRRAMFISGLQTLRITFPENIAPAGSIPEAGPARWDDVSFIGTRTRSLDPILFTSQRTGRTFVSQLNTITQTSPALIGANSLMAYSDDDGVNWTPAQLNLPDGSNDHQTVGTGPYPASLPLSNSVNRGEAVYYCGQMGNVLVATSFAMCSRSDDGGLNFGRAVPVYSGAVGLNGPSCSQLIHGHVKVAPDGTVYLPNAQCGGNQAVAVSEDAGTTWSVRTIPGSLPPSGILDPSVAVSKDAPVAPATSNTIYFAYTGPVPGGVPTDNHVFVAVSRDRGRTWSTPVDVGAGAGIRNAVFATAVAGDSNRAAVAFLGTTTGGNHQDANFRGTWYGFVAHTYDGGLTWSTVNATPNGPVQRESCIWNGGGNNPCRNLLDFNDVTVDERGRVLFGFADGCVDGCETGGANTYSAKATIARQSGGRGLFAQYDQPDLSVPQRPYLTGRRDDMASYLRWTAPDTGGSAIGSYKIYRGTAIGNEVFIGQAAGTDSSYNDRSVDPSVTNYVYKITAVNAIGESLASNTVTLAVTPRFEPTGACTLPGITAISDPAGDASDTLPQHDITSVSMSEPESLAGKLVFTIKVVNLSTIPSGWRWAVRFNAPQRPPNAVYGAPEDWFVSMVTSDGAAPTFTYGSTGVPSANGTSTARVFTTIGNLDGASNANADGTITLILPKSAIGNPTPGQSITGMLGSVRATVPSALPGTGGTNETIPDSTGAGAYTLRAANLCLPNTAPIARLTSDVDRGDAPLTVHLDASASSDADSIDTVASYTFNFGDGSNDVTQSSPTLTHVFTQPGEYAVRLVVTDSRGKLSSNTAQFLIEVEQPPVAQLERAVGVDSNYIAQTGENDRTINWFGVAGNTRTDAYELLREWMGSLLADDSRRTD